MPPPYRMRRRREAPDDGRGPLGEVRPRLRRAAGSGPSVPRAVSAAQAVPAASWGVPAVQLVLDERERQPGGLVLRQVVLVEEHDRAAGAVVEQLVVVEHHEFARDRQAPHQLGDLGDGGSGVGEARQPGHQMQPGRNVGDVADDLIQRVRIHVFECTSRPHAPPEAEARGVMLTANTSLRRRLAWRHGRARSLRDLPAA